jgi:hypothetical protein
VAYDEGLSQIFREALSECEGISEKRMMGGVCFFHYGNMLGGANRDKKNGGHLMFRVGKAQEGEALSRPGASPVILGGRRMGGMIFLDETACEPAEVQHWINLTFNFVGQMPAKTET